MKKESITERVRALLCKHYDDRTRLPFVHPAHMRVSEACMSQGDAVKLARSLVRTGRKCKLTDDELIETLEKHHQERIKQ